MNENSKNNITTDESSNNIVIHSGNSDTITIDDIGSPILLVIILPPTI